MERIADYVLEPSADTARSGAFHVARAPARLRRGDARVGVKVLQGANNADGLRRATRELRAFTAADSPHLVQPIDAGREGDYFFYAIDLPPGGTLDKPVAELSGTEVLTAVARAARGAHALHEAGLVHRAIRPASIMLYDDGARLADLGLVQLLQPGQTMTGVGMIDGVEYIEPGLLAGDLAAPASDIWSLGVTAHRALTGVGVFGELPDDDPLLCVRRVLTRRPELSPDLPEPVAAVIAECLREERADRPATALALAERWEALAVA